jgi:hypothetical protein
MRSRYVVVEPADAEEDMDDMLLAVPYKDHALDDRVDNAQEEQDSLVEDSHLELVERQDGQPCLNESTLRLMAKSVVAAVAVGFVVRNLDSLYAMNRKK